MLGQHGIHGFWFKTFTCIHHRLALPSKHIQLDDEREKLPCGQISRVLANCPGDLGSIPGRIIPKNKKMVLDATLLNTQYYKVGIEGKIEQSRERSSALP